MIQKCVLFFVLLVRVKYANIVFIYFLFFYLIITGGCEAQAVDQEFQGRAGRARLPLFRGLLGGFRCK
jgi:hypothetical protein